MGKCAKCAVDITYGVFCKDHKQHTRTPEQSENPVEGAFAGGVLVGVLFSVSIWLIVKIITT